MTKSKAIMNQSEATSSLVLEIDGIKLKDYFLRSQVGFGDLYNRFGKNSDTLKKDLKLINDLRQNNYIRGYGVSSALYKLLDDFSEVTGIMLDVSKDSQGRKIYHFYSPVSITKTYWFLTY